MRLTLRWRIVLTLLPLFALIAGIGTAGAVLLSRLGGGIGAILHNNYRSVIYMERLGESLERIDSSFAFALAGREPEARKQFAEYWESYRQWLQKEQDNITEPGEAELVDNLVAVTTQYEKGGSIFFADKPGSPLRVQQYFGDGGLLALFKTMKGFSQQILRLNQQSMERASQQAQQVAADSFLWFGAGFALAAVLALFSASHLVRSTLRPIKDVTDAALGISVGNLDQIISYPERDELGKLAAAFNSMARHLRDFRQSQSARLLRAQRTSQATIDSFPDPVIVLDSQGCVEMANPAAQNLLGVAPKQDHPSEAISWRPPESLRAPIHAALSGQSDYVPQAFDRAILFGAGGHEHALLPRILTIRAPEGGILGAAVVLQDVTRMRMLDQVKSNLVATASHELKTPLTSIRLALHLLLEEQVGSLSAKQTELLLDARENSERLLAVVNNLLDLARLERGRTQLSLIPETAEQLLRAAADAVKPRAIDKGIAIAVEADAGLPSLLVDAARLGTALNNLLDNALTHTGRGGRITLQAHADADGVTLSIADTGRGIPTEHLPHIFEKFYRVGGDHRGGTGLGLAIVHEVVAAHGGVITCESQEGIGTVFRITLPTRELIDADNNGVSISDGIGNQVQPSQ